MPDCDRFLQAIQMNDLNTASQLLNDGFISVGTSLDSRGSKALHYASIQPDVSMLNKLLAYGANPNCTNKAGVTPLHCACTMCHAKTEHIIVLLEYGANINKKADDGKAPIDIALQSTGFEGKIQTMVEAGCELTQQQRTLPEITRSLEIIQVKLDATRGVLLQFDFPETLLVDHLLPFLFRE